MNEVVIRFLSKFQELSPAEVQELALQLRVIEVSSGTMLVTQGQLCQSCFFVLQGCVRQYILQDGIEKTIGLYTEEQAINYYSGQEVAEPSASWLLSMEYCVLLLGDPEKDQELYLRYPVLLTITRRMMEIELAKSHATLASYITTSPEERYLNILQERPGLVQRVPQHILASYLGVTPESLSRIRKRLALK
ncbi:MAG: Crp/Fnr family transcriptional regulator [Cytophagaceae bacterium]|jgi:CRP-like cAMP-binding protein|nr:Crp/Fnr family transcriptional regulator [Cytophagaceae bacterium]